MKFVQVIWNQDDLPDGNVQHIGEHGLTVEDVEFVLEHPTAEGISKNTGHPCSFGYTPSGDFIIVVYEHVKDAVIYPITAYEVPEP